MALAKLAVIHGNLRHPNESIAIRRGGFENVNRLTARERYYVEGVYYARGHPHREALYCCLSESH